MSLMQSVSRFKKAKGKGYSRRAFYSPTYDVIVKVEWREKRSENCNDFMTHQSEGEIKLFDRLTEDEKQFFAIIGYFYKDGIPYIISEPCRVPEKMSKDERSAFFSRIYKSDVPGLDNVISKYQIHDLVGDNYGLTRDGRVVITDCGLWGSY